MSRPRVFYVLGSLEANDMGDEILSILARLSRASFEPRVISLGGRQDLRERIADMKVRVYPLGLSGPIGTLLSVPKVRGLLKNMEADVVHGFGSWGGAVATVAAPSEVAVVRSITRPPASGRDLKGWILNFLEKRAARREGTHFVVRSEDARGLVEDYGGGESTVLPTSVDISGIRERAREWGREGARRHLGIGDDEVAFACVAPFHSASIVDEILQGVAVARREHPGTRLFLVGGGRYEASSRWKAEELRLEDSVVFLGASGRDSDAIWAAADAVVDAAPWPGWSRGALVGQAAGLPVVKRVEGVVNGGLDEGSGAPRISGRADWFAADLVRLAREPGLRETVRTRVEGEVEANDAARVAEALRDLYKRLG